MSKLKDPMRFAAFVEGASHLRDEEILDFESKDSDITENSDVSLDDDEEENDNISYQHQPNGSYRRNDQNNLLQTAHHSSLRQQYDLSEEDDYLVDQRQLRKRLTPQKTFPDVRQRTPLHLRNSPSTSQSSQVRLSHSAPRQTSSRASLMVNSAIKTRNKKSHY